MDILAFAFIAVFCVAVSYLSWTASFSHVRQRVAFSVMMQAAAVSSLMRASSGLAPSLEIRDLFVQASLSGGAFAIAGFLLFTRSITHKFNRYDILIYALPLLISILAFTPWGLTEMNYANGDLDIVNGGLAYPLYGVYFTSIFVLAFSAFLAIRKDKSLVGQDSRAIIMMVSLFAGLLGALVVVPDIIGSSFVFRSVTIEIVLTLAILFGLAGRFFLSRRILEDQINLAALLRSVLYALGLVTVVLILASLSESYQIAWLTMMFILVTFVADNFKKVRTVRVIEVIEGSSWQGELWAELTRDGDEAGVEKVLSKTNSILQKEIGIETLSITPRNSSGQLVLDEWSSGDTRSLWLVIGESQIRLLNASKYRKAQQIVGEGLAIIRHNTKVMVVRNKHRQQAVELEQTLSKTEDAISLSSHQFRNSLAIISLNNRLLLEGFYGRQTARQRKAVQEAQDSIDSMVAVVESILEQKQESEPVDSFDVADVVRKVAESRNSVAREQKIKIISSIEEDIILMGGRTRVSEAVSAIIDNALKFADSKIHVSLRNKASKIEFIVEDDGPGLPPKANYFEKGFTTGEGDGLGLGLYLVSEVVSEHHGRLISGKSKLGGAKVGFKLPMISTEID